MSVIFMKYSTRAQDEADNEKRTLLNWNSMLGGVPINSVQNVSIHRRYYEAIIKMPKIPTLFMYNKEIITMNPKHIKEYNT